MGDTLARRDDESKIEREKQDGARRTGYSRDLPCGRRHEAKARACVSYMPVRIHCEQARDSRSRDDPTALPPRTP